MSRLRILLVEDDPSLQKIMAAVLREATDGDVVVASTLIAAVTAPGPWNLIVVDRRLPDGDGLMAAKAYPDVPSVSVSAYDGADIQKPFSMRVLKRIAREKIGLESRQGDT